MDKTRFDFSYKGGGVPWGHRADQRPRLLEEKKIRERSNEVGFEPIATCGPVSWLAVRV